MTRRWFLPETPDVLGMLRAQLGTTSEGLAAFAAWARGDEVKGDEVRELEHRADEQKRELWRALRAAFVTPIDAEDLFVMSAELDEVLNGAKDAVREADVLRVPPDAAVAKMADLLCDAGNNLDDAFAGLGDESDASTAAADAAIKSLRALERVYRQATSDVLEVTDLRELMGRRDLYSRLVALSERMRTVAERVWYAVVKEA